MGGLGEGSGPGLDQVCVLKFCFKKCFFFRHVYVQGENIPLQEKRTDFFFRNKLFALDVGDANEMKSFIDLLNDVKQRHFELYFVYRTL